jgi:hypothetical protein
MEKILKVEFFKSLSFTTKKDGMEFISKIPQLKQEFDNNNNKLEQFHFQLIDDYNSQFDKFENEKKAFQMYAKNERKILTQEKKSKIDEDLEKNFKDSLKIDIEKQFYKEQFSSLIPDYKREDVAKLVGIDDIFISLSKKHKLQSSDIIQMIELHKQKTEELLSQLYNIYITMEKLNASI